MVATGSEVQVWPAEPLLASSLVGDEVLEGLFDGVVSGKVGLGTRKSRERYVHRDGKVGVLDMGVKSLNVALEGGVEEGSVVGVSCEVGGLGGEVCLALLANSLLQKPGSTAAVIDTTGNLDIFRLYTLILSRLQADASLLTAITTAGTRDHTPESVAAKMLDRVKLMRAFDLVGVMEAVGEIRDGLEGKEKLGLPGEKKKDTKEGESKVVVDKAPPPKKTVIADSEDEEEEDEMLFETEAAYQGKLEHVAPPVLPAAPIAHPVQDPSEATEERTEGEGKASFILIDNLAHVVNPLLKKDCVHAHALTSTFLLTLSDLTRTHTLHTLLLNPCTLLVPRPPAPIPPTISNEQQPPPPPPQQQQYHIPPLPSIFASNKFVPALANVLGLYLDLHLLVERMPKRKADARVLYAEDGERRVRGVRGGRGPDMVGVMEVLSDRWGGRVGAWGAFGAGEKGMEDF